MAEKESAFFQACRLIDRRLKEQERVAVALEGGAASGKTTLAAQLSAHYGAPVIAMDDFFLPPALRTPERYSLPGGNIDFERFNAQVAAPLREGRAFSYPVYDCHADRMAGEKRVPLCPLVLVEGVYSLHPAYRDIYGLRLFLRTAPETQDARLRARGEEMYRRFQALWLPLEKRYFDAEDWPRVCDAVLET